MNNYFKKLVMFMLCFIFIFTLAACTNENVDDSGYKDTIERPTDIPPLAELDYVKYPAKPTNLSAGQGSGMPQIGTATTESEDYTLSQADGKITVTYNEISNWDYIYLPISNFNKEYQNIKITATGTNVQNVSFTVVYYEMYDLGYPAVTALTHQVGDTEQYYIMELGKVKLLSESYYPLEEVLGDQTVIGLCIFIDSNPSLTSMSNDKEKTFEISNVEFLKDGDEAIKDIYVDPSVSVGYLDSGYLAEKNDETKEITISKSSSALIYESATLNVSNYSSDYSAFNFNFTTQNVNTITVELLISGGLEDWAPTVLVYKETNLEDGSHSAYIDFSSTQPSNAITWQPVAGYFIKNYKIIGIKIFLDTADEGKLVEEDATCVVNEIAFERIVNEGTVISRGWAAGSGNMVLGDDIQVGGIGTVNLTWHNSWECLTIPVLNYTPSNKLTITFQANEGIDYLGVAIVNSQLPAANGEAVLKSCWNDVNTVAEKVNECQGLVETVEYDSETKIYTITFDFTNCVKLEGLDNKAINEVIISALRFYFTDPDSKAVYDGTRSIRFINISFE